MSLATRCPSCGTIFRVVQDQLKVSEGWVRCGQCHEVFHGIESLFDLESDAALAARRAARQAAAPAPAATRQAPGERAAFANAPTAPVPLASAPAAPGRGLPPPPSTAPATRGIPPTPPVAPARTATPAAPLPASAPAAAPARPVAAPAPSEERGTDSGLASGFAPAASPAAPRGMAPRFAARWAEAARERAARQAQASPPLAETRPTFAGTPAPAPTFGTPIAGAAPPASATTAVPETRATSAAPAAMAEPAATAQLEPPPPSFDAPTQPMGLDPADREHVDIALFDEAPAPPEAMAPAPMPGPVEAAAPHLPSFEGELSDEEAAAAARAAEFAAPPDAAAEAPVDEDEDEDEDAADAPAGPPTLASMLPEPTATWPPRARRGRKRDAAKTPEASAEDAGAPVLESQREHERHHPRFVREARRDERWSRPWVRASLGATLALLVVAAIGQMAFPWRDTIASRWPSTAPLWSLVCEPPACRIEAPRSIASLTLDGSSLTRTDVDHVLLFSADLHNRSDHAVRMPSFDLSFMDLNGQVVARKVLDPAQIGIRQDALGPEGELHVHARIQVAGLEASGFQAEMFYP